MFQRKTIYIKKGGTEIQITGYPFIQALNILANLDVTKVKYTKEGTPIGFQHEEASAG